MIIKILVANKNEFHGLVAKWPFSTSENNSTPTITLSEGVAMPNASLLGLPTVWS